MGPKVKVSTQKKSSNKRVVSIKGKPYEPHMGEPSQNGNQIHDDDSGSAEKENSSDNKYASPEFEERRKKD